MIKVHWLELTAYFLLSGAFGAAIVKVTTPDSTCVDTETQEVLVIEEDEIGYDVEIKFTIPVGGNDDSQ